MSFLGMLIGRYFRLKSFKCDAGVQQGLSPQHPPDFNYHDSGLRNVKNQLLELWWLMWAN